MKVEDYEDIGDHTRTFLTKSKEVFIYCNRALIKMFGFCYPEAKRSLQKKSEFD